MRIETDGESVTVESEPGDRELLALTTKVLQAGSSVLFGVADIADVVREYEQREDRESINLTDEQLERLREIEQEDSDEPK